MQIRSERIIKSPILQRIVQGVISTSIILIYGNNSMKYNSMVTTEPLTAKTIQYWKNIREKENSQHQCKWLYDPKE